MKKLISKFSDKLLSNQQLKVVKGGGTPYCFCDGSPIDCGSGQSEGSEICANQGTNLNWGHYSHKYYKGANGPWDCGSNGYTSYGYGC